MSLKRPYVNAKLRSRCVWLYTMMYPKAGCLNILLFALTRTVLTVSFGKYYIDVNIFLDEPNVDLTTLVQEVVERYQFDQDRLSEKAVGLNFRLVKYNRTVSSIFTLDFDRFCNLSVSLCSIIFVQVTSHELFLSSLMERSNIATIGLFQTSGVPLTQVLRKSV